MNEIVKHEAEKPMAISPQADALMAMLSDPEKINSMDVDKLDRLMAMAERLQAKRNEQAFNQAMADVQAKMKRVRADASNPQTRSKYASYAALDRELRPIYTDGGFALSFDTGEAPQPDMVRVICYVTHDSGFSRTYHVDMPADGKGAKGGDVMTKTHATGSAMSYGMRYLLKLIFNVAVGEDDDDGNRAALPSITEDQLKDLECLIEEVGANKHGFLKYCTQMFGVRELSELCAKDYPAAVAALEKKRKAK